MNVPEFLYLFLLVECGDGFEIESTHISDNNGNRDTGVNLDQRGFMQ
jgi:hypothetical protein